MKEYFNKFNKTFTNTLILFIASPFLLVFVLLFCIIYTLIAPFEYILYKSKYLFLGKYYPYKLYFERLAIYFFKHIKKFNKENYLKYNSQWRYFIYNDICYYFKYSNVSNIHDKKIKITSKKDILRKIY